MDWNKEMVNRAIDLKDSGYTYTQAAKILQDEFNVTFTGDAVRLKLKRAGYEMTESQKRSYDDDGVQTSTTIVRVIKGKKLTPAELLRAHGYDPELWQIVSAVSNHWKQTPTANMFQSKISIKPLVDPDAYEKLLDNIVDHKKPYAEKPTYYFDSERYLVIPAFDLHFNGHTLDLYKESLQRQIEIIENGHYAKILLILGGDIAHIDNINSTTARGTQLETTDLDATVTEMESYFEPLIETIIKHSNSAEIMYCPGNHDPSVGFMFARLLERAYSKQPNITWDVSLKHYHGTMLGHNFIGATHGDKGKANYLAKYLDEFGSDLGKAKNRELFTGHLHSEMSKDLGGFVQRQVSTRKPTDKWTDDIGVVAHKTFELVEYADHDTRAIYYV